MITEKSLKKAARSHSQSSTLTHAQSLEWLSEQQGFSSYAALKKALDKFSDNALFNPERLEFAQDFLSKLQAEGKIDQNNKDDISILTWATRVFRNQSSFSIPFFDLTKSEKDLSYAHKVVQSFSMIYYGTRKYISNMPSKTSYRDYITSSFDVCFPLEYMLEDTKRHIQPSKMRCKLHHFPKGAVQFVEFDFAKEQTTVYVNPYFYISTTEEEDMIHSYRRLFLFNKIDLILPFVFDAFPFYNVAQIVLIPRNIEACGWEFDSLVVSRRGIEEKNIPAEYFSMGGNLFKKKTVVYPWFFYR